MFQCLVISVHLLGDSSISLCINANDDFTEAAELMSSYFNNRFAQVAAILTSESGGKTALEPAVDE